MIGSGYVKNHVWHEGKLGSEENKSGAVYEVIRLKEGRVMFFEDHVARLKQSLILSNIRGAVSEERVWSDIALLIQNTGIRTNNIKLECFEEMGFQLQLYMIESVYPEEKTYEEGVQTVAKQIQRIAPGTKIYRKDYKQKVAQILSAEKAFEVLLVDEDGKIREGSRSNFFYLKAGNLYTAPEGTVLSGVTRRYVISCIQNLGLTLHYHMLPQAEISFIEGAFLTGTSIGVLPIQKVGSVQLSSAQNETIKRLIRAYEVQVAQNMSHEVKY